MIETLEEKTHGTTHIISSQEHEPQTEEKLRIPPSYPPKHTEAEGAQLDMGIQSRNIDYILVLVHPQTRQASDHLSSTKNRITYKFHTLSVDELNDIFIKSLSEQPRRSRQLPPRIFKHEYQYSLLLQEEIYHAAAELYRTHR